jgi:hypothetical protein
VFAGNLHIKVHRDDDRTAFINESASIADKLLVVSVPYKLEPVERVWDIHLKKEVPEVVLKGTIEFYLAIEHESKTDGAGKEVHRYPQLSLRVNTHHNIHMDRSCKYHPRYCQIVSELHGFVKRFITLNDELYFDHVSSARTLKGLMMNFNAQAKENAWSHFVGFDFKAQAMRLLLGCGQEHLDQMALSPVESNQIEVALGNNFLELAYPYHVEKDIANLLEIAKKGLKE